MPKKGNCNTMKHLPVWHATLQTSLCCCFSVLLVGLSYVSFTGLIHLLFLPYARVWHTILIKYMPRQRNQSHNYPRPARGIAWELGMISLLPFSLPACLVCSLSCFILSLNHKHLVIVRGYKARLAANALSKGGTKLK